MNYTFFPQSLENFVHDDSITWLVVKRCDWEDNLIVGPTFSAFSVVRQYLNENPNINFIITGV